MKKDHNLKGKVVEVKKAFPRNREGGGNQQGATPYTRNPKPEPLHTKPETTFTRNPKPETLHSKSETRKQYSMLTLIPVSSTLNPDS